MKKLPLILIINLLFFIGFVNFSIVKAQEENIEDAEIIKPVQSVICTDFNIDLSKENEEPDTLNNSLGSSSQVQGTETWRDDKNQPIKGNIFLKDIKQPDFSQMDNYLQSAIPKLLPIGLTGKVDIKTKNFTNLESRQLHLVYGDMSGPNEVLWGGDVGKSELFPGTKIKNPEWWTNLLGQSRIFCGILTKNSKICEAPKKLNLVIEQPEFETTSSTEVNPDPKHQLIGMKGSGTCVKDDLALGQKPEIEDAGTEFETGSFFEIIKEKIERIIDKIKNIFILTKEKSQLREESWGYLIGGASLATESAFFGSFIPYDIDSKITKSPLAGDSSYLVEIKDYSDVSISGDDKKNNFQGQNLPKARYCLQLCSLYPPDTKFNVSNIDPLCISCDPKDYQN